MTSSGAIADCRKVLTRAWNHISFFQTYFQSSLLLLLYWYNWKWAFTHNGRPNTHSACLPDQKHLTNGDQIIVTSRSDAFQFRPAISGKPRLGSVHLSDFIQTMNVRLKIIQFLLMHAMFTVFCLRLISDKSKHVMLQKSIRSLWSCKPSICHNDVWLPAASQSYSFSWLDIF